MRLDDGELHVPGEQQGGRTPTMAHHVPVHREIRAQSTSDLCASRRMLRGGRNSSRILCWSEFAMRGLQP